MSTYIRKTKHPKTGKWEDATWYDDLLGHHHYGVIFPSDAKEAQIERYVGTTTWQSVAIGIAYDPKQYKLETKFKS